MKRLILLLAAALTFTAGRAQNTDRYEKAKDYVEDTQRTDEFRMRFGIDVKKRLARGLDLSLNEEFRVEDNMKKVDRLNTQIALSYKVNRYFRVKANYVLMAMYDTKRDDTGAITDRDWSLRHRFALDLVATYPVGHWRFSLRERIQTTIRTDSIDSREKVSPAWCLRHRLQVQYEPPYKPIKPYAYVELRNTLNVQDVVGENYLSRVRVGLGLEYILNARSSLDFYYMFDYAKDYDVGFTRNKGLLKEFITELGYYHTLGVQYNFKF